MQNREKTDEGGAVAEIVCRLPVSRSYVCSQIEGQYRLSYDSLTGKFNKFRDPTYVKFDRGGMKQDRV